MSQSPDYVYTLYFSDNYYLVVFNKGLSVVSDEFSITVGELMINDVVVSSSDFLYFCGRSSTPHSDYFYLSKAHYSVISALDSWNPDEHTLLNPNILYPIVAPYSSQSYSSVPLTVIVDAGFILNTEDLSGRDVQYEESFSMWVDDEHVYVSTRAFVELEFKWP